MASVMARHCLGLRPGNILNVFLLVNIFGLSLKILGLPRLNYYACGSEKVGRFMQLIFHSFCFCFSGKPCPAFKLVILDEADSMTPSAQVHLFLMLFTNHDNLSLLMIFLYSHHLFVG